MSWILELPERLLLVATLAVLARGFVGLGCGDKYSAGMAQKEMDQPRAWE